MSHPKRPSEGPFDVPGFSPGIWIAIGDIGQKAARPEPPRAPVSVTPFAWQHGQRLLILDHELTGEWVLAELRFDNAQCRYVEVRRARYEWDREAMGAFLSLALASGEIPAEESAKRLSNWFAAQTLEADRSPH
jgi:hypothetical protein